MAKTFWSRWLMEALAEMPALQVSAKDWGREIAFAAEDARRSDQQAFAYASASLSGWSGK